MVSNQRENMERNEVREGPIAIAIDRDKTSCHALKWAVDHYIPQGGNIKLVNVTQRSSLNVNDDALSNDKQNAKFLPMKCLCMRRNIQSEIVLLEDQDVAKALIEYITHNGISTFVIGASLKNSITRLFKADDISSNVMRWAPDFCTVLLISKGKLSSVRSATRPLPRALSSSSSLTTPLSPHNNITNNEAPFEMLLSREDDVFLEEFSSSLDTDSSMNINERISTDSTVLSFYEKLGAPQMLEIPRFSSTIDDVKSEFSTCLNSPCDEKSSTLALKRELKETMNMYHAACKEALMAKEKAIELEILKKEIEERLQVAEEKAKMVIMEMEKMRRRGSDSREMVMDVLGESRVVAKYESLLHILVVIFLFFFYFTFR